MSRKPALDDAEKRRAYEVYKTGANDNVIALKLGCSVDQVKRWRAATGLPEGGTVAPKPEEPKSSPAVVIKPADKSEEPEAPEPEQEEPQRVRTIFDFASELAAELSIKELKILLSTMGTSFCSARSRSRKSSTMCRSQLKSCSTRACSVLINENRGDFRLERCVCCRRVWNVSQEAEITSVYGYICPECSVGRVRPSRRYINATIEQ